VDGHRDAEREAKDEGTPGLKSIEGFRHFETPDFEVFPWFTYANMRWEEGLLPTHRKERDEWGTRFSRLLLRAEGHWLFYGFAHAVSWLL
jgi:hypothetical protein